MLDAQFAFMSVMALHMIWVHALLTVEDHEPSAWQARVGVPVQPAMQAPVPDAKERVTGHTAFEKVTEGHWF